VFSGLHEVRGHLVSVGFGDTEFGAGDVDGVRHVHEPPIALERPDRETHVAHTKSRVAALLEILGHTTPVMREEQRQSPSGPRQIGLVGIERPENAITYDSVVEDVDQSIEEWLAPDPREEVGFAHENFGSSQSGNTSGRPSLTLTGNAAGRFSRKLTTPSRASALAPRELIARESTRCASIG